ncbi:OmpA family protein [Paracraurococcus lichenis]|uniref:OmpA family protein n=1 Tax=Paracraurococcus lichenis TaxID=3064888 RepID=A0ABT9DWZ4_9PROT|nr:OmpA family protein [Paracraurococcus sp. LOR1-02]MDO9708408.1 OmpA family protein [Paracraurococcus sp. LOR1-02]
MRRRLALLALPLLALAACQQPAAVGAAPASVVFFNQDSAALDESGAAVVAQAAALAKERPGQAVRVRGFAASTAGTPGFNQALANARAQHVADHLAEAGVERSRIRIEPRGALAPSDPSFPTEARRVEILIGG